MMVEQPSLTVIVAVPQAIGSAESITLRPTLIASRLPVA
jgi:hypothetical protein